MSSTANKKYLTAKTFAIFFGITTALLFLISHDGLWRRYISIEVFTAIYLANFAFLMVSLVVFAWQRAKHDGASPDNNILEHIKDESDEE